MLKDKQMLKVVYVCSSLKRTGPINIVYNIINSPEYTGIEPIIVTLSAEEEDSRKTDFEDSGAKVICLKLSHSNLSLLHTGKLLKALEEINPDIIHCCGFRADFMCSQKMIQDRFRVTSTLHNYPYEDYTMLYGKLKGSIMARLHLMTLGRMKIVSTCSDFIRNKMIRHGLNNFITIHNGVDNRLFEPLPREQKAELRKQHRIAPDAIVFIFVGYLIKRKNPEILVKAFKELCKSSQPQNIHLIVVGDGPLMNACKEIYNENNISYIGNQSSTKKWLEMSDVYVSPSYSEGFPTAVMEAMASGLACILSDIEPHAEMVAPMSRQHLFAPDDYVSAANLMETMARCNDLQECQKEARNYFDHNLSSDIMARKHLEIYHRLSL